MVMGRNFSSSFHWKIEDTKRFDAKTGSELGFECYLNSESSMNTRIFFEWLEPFDTYTGGIKNRTALLLIDNALCHCRSENLLIFLNIEVSSLPPKKQFYT